MKRTTTTTFHQPNNTDIPADDACNDNASNNPGPQRVAPTMYVPNATPHPMGAAGQPQVTAIQSLGLTSQPLLISRGQTTVTQKTSGSAQKKSMKGPDINLANKNGQTRLMLAAQDGKLPEVQTLLSSGAKINATDNDGWTPLMYAAKNGDLTIVQALLSAPRIDIDAENTDGTTAVLVATDLGEEDVVKALIGHGANVNTPDNHGWTPLMAAAQDGCLTIVKILLCAPQIDIHAKKYDGMNALMFAAGNDKDDIVKVLIEHGANVNSTSINGSTPLMLAAQKGNLPTVQALLSAPRVDINAWDGSGATALMGAIRFGKDDVVKALIGHGADVNITDNAGRRPLIWGVRRGCLTIVKILLSAPQIDINAKEATGDTALYVAVTQKHADIVEALINHGADINQTYERIKASLNLASPDLLINYLAQRQPNVGDLHKEATWTSAFATSAIPPKTIVKHSTESLALDTLVEQAQMQGYSLTQISFQVVRDQLLKQELSATQIVKLINTFSSSPFETALAQTLAIAIKLGGYRTNSEHQLIHNALRTSRLIGDYEKSKSQLSPDNINRWQMSGQTLLTRAAQAGDQMLVNMLIKCGASYHLPDQHGNNALHAAVKAGKWSVCSDLLARGANPNSSDRNGVSTLTYLAKAFAKGDEKTATIVAKLMSPLLAKGYGLNRVVQDPEAVEQRRSTTILEILRSDLNRYALHLDLLYADNINLADDRGQTPLMFAAKKGYLGSVQAFLGVFGIDINAKKIDGESALYMAAHHGKYDVVKALIQKGANVNITTDNGWTPLMAAANQGHLTIMQALLDKNADIKQTNGDGMTVFDIIERKDSNEVKVRLLELVQKYRT